MKDEEGDKENSQGPRSESSDDQTIMSDSESNVDAGELIRNAANWSRYEYKYVSANLKVPVL